MAKRYAKNPLRVIVKLGTKAFVEAKERNGDTPRDVFVEAQEEFELKKGNHVRPFRVSLKQGTKTLKVFGVARDEGPMDVLGKAYEWYQENNKTNTGDE
jgi:hypothetical protein